MCSRNSRACLSAVCRERTAVLVARALLAIVESLQIVVYLLIPIASISTLAIRSHDVRILEVRTQCRAASGARLPRSWALGVLSCIDDETKL